MFTQENYADALTYAITQAREAEEKIKKITTERDELKTLLFDIQTDLKEVTQQRERLLSEVETLKKKNQNLQTLFDKVKKKRDEISQTKQNTFDERYIKYLSVASPEHRDLKIYQQEQIFNSGIQSQRQDIMSFNDKYIVSASSEYSVRPEYLSVAKTDKHYAKYLFYPHSTEIDSRYWSTADRNPSGWAQIEFSKPKKVIMYRLLPESYHESRFNLRPNKWSIEGSNDGEVWTCLDEQEVDINSKFWLKQGSTYSEFMKINEPEFYKFYRLNVSSQHPYQCIVRRLNMYGYTL
jgi:hypothetical protein